MAGHPQAAKLKLTSNLPRSPGVYLFCGHRDEVLYVGKATNLRQRVRSYFGREDRRRIGPMLREAQAVRHHCLPDPLSAEVVEARLIARLKPRYNRAGTRADRYCYVRLDVDSAWPRLAIVRDPARTGVHLGPLPSRTMATLVVEALQAALPLRRCSVRLGRDHQPPLDATPCAAAQMGVAACPCAGLADRRAVRRRRRRRRRAMTEGRTDVGRRAADRADARASPPRSATRRRRWSATACRRSRARSRAPVRWTTCSTAAASRSRRGDVTWVVDHARLVDVRVAGSTAGALPAPHPPAPPAAAARSPALLADEALVLARRLAHVRRL